MLEGFARLEAEPCDSGPGASQGGSAEGTLQVARPAGMTSRFVRMVCSFRKQRQEHFPAGALGTETSWDVLLQLYAAHLDQHRVNISLLTERTGAPPTTVLRAIEALRSAGMLCRAEDRFDRRRVYVELSERGASAMTAYLKSGCQAALF